MQRLKQNLLIVAAIMVLGITGLLMSSQQAVAQNPKPGSAPVNIVSPLPLPVTGSLEVGGTVNVRDVDKTVRTPFQIRAKQRRRHYQLFYGGSQSELNNRVRNLRLFGPTERSASRRCYRLYFENYRWDRNCGA